MKIVGVAVSAPVVGIALVIAGFVAVRCWSQTRCAQKQRGNGEKNGKKVWY